MCHALPPQLAPTAGLPASDWTQRGQPPVTDSEADGLGVVSTGWGDGVGGMDGEANDLFDAYSLLYPSGNTSYDAPRGYHDLEEYNDISGS
jgi:hypothetical protein